MDSSSLLQHPFFLFSDFFHLKPCFSIVLLLFVNEKRKAVERMVMVLQAAAEPRGGQQGPGPGPLQNFFF
jgi:hypothetical protein